MANDADASDSGEPLAALCKSLIEANIAFQIEKDGGRILAIHALTAIVKYFMHVPKIGPCGLNVPLLVLLDALMALEAGETKPILKARRVSGRPPASALSESNMGAAAFIVRKLQAAGMTSKDALRAVAKTMTAAGAVKSRGSSQAVTERTVRTWLERVDTDVGRHGQAAQTFDELQAKNPISELTSVADAKRIYLELLRAMIMRSRGGQT